MPGHNFILLALRGNLLDLRGIKRQFLQLTSDAFSYFSLICIACALSMRASEKADGLEGEGE